MREPGGTRRKAAHFPPQRRHIVSQLPQAPSRHKTLWLFLLLLGLTAAVWAEPTIGPDDVLYFPMTDRFYRGDKTRTLELQPANPWGWHGGDLRGLAQKADYLRDLGVTVLWLGPFQKNSDELHFGTFVGKGFHGYWINDHEKVEPHQGTEADLVATVKTFKSKGIKVIADVVLNQVGPDHPWVRDPAKRDWFHHEGPINDYNNQHQVEYGDLGGLPDLDQDNPAVYRYLLNNTAYWVKKLDLDGVRLDAVKHIPKRFWTTFIPDLRRECGKPELFILGEVLRGDAEYVAGYQRTGVEYLFDIALRDTMVEVFGKDASAKQLSSRLAEDRLYPDANKLVTLIDNHDLPRFMTSAQGDFNTRLERLKLSCAFLICVRGMPSFYYGTETAMEGSDPDNRRDMEFDRHPEMRQYFTRLLQIRRATPALRRGEQKELLADDQVYAFTRKTSEQEAICVFNASGQPQSRTLHLSAASGTLTDSLSGRRFKIREHRLLLNLPARTPLILVKTPI